MGKLMLHDRPYSGGQPTHIYSTDEHKVGVWIDGSTIYEKTYKIDNPTSTTSPTILITLTNNENVIDLQGCLEMGSGAKFFNNFQETINYQLRLWVEGNIIKYRATCSGDTLADILVTIKYTKTTS